MAAVGSTGSDGKTCRQDVLGGVVVPVVPGAAGRAHPGAGAQAQGGEQVPARRAGFRGPIPAVNDDQAPTCPLGLISQQAPEGAPAAVADRLGKPPVAGHGSYVQIFDHEQVVVADQAGADPMQEVSPSSPHLAVGTGDLRCGHSPVGRAVLRTGHAPLVAGEVGGFAFQVSGIGDALAVAGHGEVADPQVDPDRPAGCGQRRWVGHLRVEGGVPASVRVAGDSHAGRFQEDRVDLRPRPDQSQRRLRLGQPQPPMLPAKRAAGVAGRLPAATRRASWVAGTPGVKRVDGAMLVPQRLLQRHRGHLIQEAQLGQTFHSGQRRVRLPVGGAFALGRPAGVAGGQSAVPHNPDAPERSGQHDLLLGVRVGPAFVRHSHPATVHRVCDMVSAIPHQPEGHDPPLARLF